MGSSIPATLPGLLRRGTGVLHANYDSLVVIGPSGDGTGRYDCAAPDSGYSLHPDTLTLDLDNATTRAHLAWWILDRAADPYFARMDRDEFAATVDAAERAYRGRPMNDRHINTLTTVARRLAGLESS